MCRFTQGSFQKFAGYGAKQRAEGLQSLSMQRGFMLDTCTFDRILDGCEMAGTWSLRGPLYITDIQLQEISQTRDPPGRREALLDVVMSLRPSVLRPGWLPFDHEVFGFEPEEDAGFTLSDGIYHPASVGRLLPVIAAVLGSRFERAARDALIAEAALTAGLTLVTADAKLARVARDFGARVESIP